MAQELSQAELLDFLCQAGGRVTNAALLGHFKRFLRDPGASPGQLQRRRELFKGFVNSVATVQQERAPGAAKYVVLRKRYRELVGEEPKPPAEAHAQAPGESQAAQQPPPPPEVQRSRAQQQWQQGRAGSERGAPRAQGEGCRRRRRQERPRNQEEEERSASLTCRGWAQELRACPPPGTGRCLPGDLRGGGGAAAAQLPPSPASFGCPGRLPERCAQSDPQQPPQQRWPFPGGVPLFPRREAPLQSRRPALPVRDMGAPPRDSHPQQRVREWVERAHAETHHSRLSPDPLPPPPEEGPWRPARPSSPPSPAGRSPSPPLDAQGGGGQPLAVGLWPDRVSVFRSIRSQLFLQDLEDFLEQESPASEDGSSASGGSDRENGALPPLSPSQNGYSSDPVEAALARAKGSPCKPQANGLLLPATPPKGSPPQEGTTLPRRIGLLAQDARGSSSSDELLDKSARRQSKQLPTFRKVARLPPPPHLDAPLSPRPVPRQAHPASVPEVGGLGLDAEGSTEHRSSLVPLEPREHAWLVKVATGSWLEAHALLLEDPHLATRKDFISGYTVLHWLAKHGNAKVLQDVVTGAQEAGVALDVNAKSGCGYTPLHLAAMHGHQPVMQLLVQKLQCQIQVRDSSGKRPWQYLGSTTSGEVWQLLGAPRGKTIFPARPIARINSSASSAAKNGKSPQLGRKISRKASLAAYLKPQHIKWKMANKYPALQEREEYSD